MKSIFKRLICVCMVVLLCFSSISILNAFADEEPALSKRCKTLIDASGNEDINFGDKPSDIRSRSHKKLSSAIDLSTADVFELDVYIQDINALKTVMPETSKLNFCFSSSTHKTNYNTKYAIANISEQLISSGWNHIEIKKSDFTESSIVWTGVLHYYLKFSDETFDMPAGLKNKEVKIRNICESYAVPEVTDGGTLLPDAMVFGTLGENSESKLSEIGNTFNANGAATDFSDAIFVKVDLLIPSFTEFNTFVSNKDFKFVLSSESGSATATFGGAYFPAAVSGWYTVQLPVSDFVKSESFDFSAVTGFEIDINDGADSAIGDAYSLQFGFANVRGFSIDYPEGDIFFGKTVADYAVSKETVEFGNTYGDFAYSKSADFTALSDAENIEFYIYVQEPDNFKNFFKYDRSSSPVTASFDLTLSQGANTIKWTGIEEKVITSGWNHIILPVADANNCGFDVNTKFNKIKFDVSGVDLTNLSNNYGSFVIIEKLLATKGTAAKGELEFEKTKILSNGKSYKLGDTFVALSEKLEASVDSTGTKFIEFDIFVQNAETFKTIMGENGVTGISLCLSSTDNDDFTKNSLSTKISEKIYKNGWNHIAVPFRNFKDGTAIGTFDETAVTAWSILFNSTSVSSTGALKGQLLSIENITLTDVIDPVIPSTADPVISQEGKSGIYGDKYSDTLENSRIILENPVDITRYSRLQFDFYVEDYEAFTKMLSGTSNKLCFGLGTSADISKAIALYDFTDQVTGNGWNRIVLTNTIYTKQNGNPDIKTVYNAFLTFGTDDSANPYGDLYFKLKNICSVPHERDIAPEPPEYVVDLWKDGKTDRWGDQYVNAKMTFRKDLSSSPVDVSDIDSIEFDVYIEDYESFVSTEEKGTLYFVLGSDASDFNKGIARYSFAKQITHDGWNHIAITRSSYVSNWDTDFNNIRWVYITFWSGAVQYSPNPIGDTLFRIVNVVGTHAEYRKVPALPDNVVAVLGDETEGIYFAGNTVGQKYHFTLDRIYKQRFSPIDFSKTNKIEFDVYIDDYEKLLAAENDPTNERESKLAFVVSSTKPALWDQYSAPRAYFSSSVLIADHVKHSGWNHVVVGKQDFVAFNNGGVNWSAITAFMVYYRSSSNYYPYDNHYSDLYVKVGNIVNTGIYVEVPKDGEKQEYVDKSAVYITNLDVLADENGAWNLMDGGVNTDYKTEGKGSILQTVNYTHTTDNTKMLYIFDETADMSDLKTLKFDFFVDIPGNIQRPGNNIQIILANDRFVKTDYCYWDLDLSSLKSGWNSIELPISKVKQVGNVDVAGVKVFMLRFNKLNLDKENFAVVLYGLDNLRYISSTGSTTLKINTFDEDDFEDDFDDMFDDEFDDEFDDIDDLTDVDVKGDTIYKKTVERIKVIDYTMIIIALAAEAAAIIIGLVIFTIIYEKKHKKNI